VRSLPSSSLHLFTMPTSNASQAPARPLSIPDQAREASEEPPACHPLHFRAGRADAREPRPPPLPLLSSAPPPPPPPILSPASPCPLRLLLPLSGLPTFPLASSRPTAAQPSYRRPCGQRQRSPGQRNDTRDPGQAASQPAPMPPSCNSILGWAGSAHALNQARCFWTDAGDGRPAGHSLQDDHETKPHPGTSHSPPPPFPVFLSRPSPMSAPQRMCNPCAGEAPKGCRKTHRPPRLW